jgi:predicted flap endonuclease-1-like 5' DNA nuclease
MFHKHGISLGTLMACLAPTTTSSSSQATGEQGGVPWWVWVIVGLVVVALLLWWWLRSRRGSESTQTDKVEALVATPAATQAAPAEPAPLATPAPVTPDDLKLIEGIGPKISDVLQAAGIATFAKLAATDVTRLTQILAEANLAALADPRTWPEQAGLAAAGKWDELQTLQNELKGGRRA